MTILLLAIPFFIITMLGEWRLSQKSLAKGYGAADTAASLSLGLGNLAVMFGAKAATIGVYMALYEYRFFDLPSEGAWVWLVLIPCDDFCYYWFHRSCHQMRFFWASHVNHHSSTRYNLSTALRQSWTGPLTSWVFWLPLPLLGFDPLLIVLAQSASLLYQYWIHTELVDRLGPLEWFMNTPSHHRVHHGSNAKYLDRNHGGIFIVWDRLFGTFQEEQETPDYGLTTNIGSYNPVVIAFHEWVALARDLRGATSLSGAFGYLTRPPGWREDGTGITSDDLRKEARNG